MKKTALVIIFFLFSASALPSFAAEDANAKKEKCRVDDIQESPNPIISILSFPFKMVYAISFGPRCLIESIPKNEE